MRSIRGLFARSRKQKQTAHVWDFGHFAHEMGETIQQRAMPMWLSFLIIFSTISSSLVFYTSVVQAGAGEIEHYSAKRVSQQSSTSAGWSAVTGTADTGTTASTNGWVDSTNLTTGDRYLIMVWGAHISSPVASTSGMRVSHGGTAFTESQSILETDPGSINRIRPYFWFTVWEAVSGEDIEVEYYLDSGTKYAEDVTLVVMHAEDLLANGYLKYDIETEGGTLTTTPDAKADIKWTPETASEEWWVMSYAQGDAVDTGSDFFEGRLEVGGTNYGTFSIEIADTPDTPIDYLGWTGTLAASEQTASIELSESAADQEWDSAGIFALRLNTFETFANSYTTGSEALETQNSPEEIQSIAPNVATAGDFLVVGGLESDDNNSQVRIFLEEDTTQITDDVGGWNYNAADVWGLSAAEMFIDETTGLKDYSMDAEGIGGTAGAVADRWMVGFSMELDVAFPTDFPTIRGISSGYTADHSLNYSVTTPTETVSGDLLILFQHAGNGGVTVEATWGQVGTGFTFENSFGSGSNESASSWSRTADSGDASGGGSYTFNTTGSGDALRWVMLAIDNHNGVDVVEGYADADITTSPGVSDSITPTEADGLLLAFLAKDQNSGSTTELWDDETTMVEEAEYTNEGDILYTSVYSEKTTSTSALTREFNLVDSGITGTAKQIMVHILPGAGGGGGGGSTAVSQLSLAGYIWENDDEDSSTGDAYDENSQLAAGSTALTNVRPGERLTLRAQIENSSPIAHAATDDLALFYDRNDGLWTRVEDSASVDTSAGSGCSDTDFTCSVLYDDATHASIATNPATGLPVVALRDTSSFDTVIAMYVGSGGTGCGTGVTDWSCETIETQDGEYVDIAVSATGEIWIKHYGTNDDLDIAHFVGSGGTGCFGGNTRWDCIDIEAFTAGADGGDLVLDENGDPAIAYLDPDTSDHRVARYVGTGGSGCDTAGADWDCDTIESTDVVSSNSAITVNADGDLVTFYANTTDDDLYQATYVGSGGTGCADAAWTCTLVIAESSTNGPDNIQATAGADGNPWISYHDNNGDDIRVAHYVGGNAGNCDTEITGSSDDWDCYEVATTGSLGVWSAIEVGPDGNPVLMYDDDNNDDTVWARYVGSGGTGCTDAAWTGCADLIGDGSNQYRQFPDLTFDGNGQPWMVYVDSTNNDVYVAHTERSGEISAVPSVAGDDGDAISESHADMTSTSDTSNRDDADCIGTGGTPAFTTGALFESSTGTGVALADGSTNLQCTEVAWVIDTTNAVAGETYRFAIASDTGDNPDKSFWRGMVSTTAFPTLTMTNVDTSLISKDAWPAYSDCSGSADWTCETIDSDATDDVGRDPSFAFAPDGTPWVSYFVDATTDTLNVARYVGSGGTGCDVASWDCDVVVSGTAATETSLQFSSDGTAWLAFTNNNAASIEIARYVGDGTGTGCTSSDWECTLIEDPGGRSVGRALDLAIHPVSDTPWISYADYTNDDLYVAFYVGGGLGTGCADSTDWTCELVEDTVNITHTTLGNTSIEISEAGEIFIAYQNAATTRDLLFTQFVGSGGTGCTTERWHCTEVDTTDTAGEDLYLALDNNGVPAIVYGINANSFKIAEYVGTSGTGCTSTAWDCSAILSGSGKGLEDNYFEYNDDNEPWILTTDGGANVTIASYVGTGGSCNDTAYECTDIYTGAASVLPGDIHFDNSGVPWVVWHDNTATGGSLEIARLKLDVSDDNALRYSLTPGSTTRDTVPNCNATTSYEGYCGTQEIDGSFDIVSAGAVENAAFLGYIYTDNNSQAPRVRWNGQTTLAPNTASTAGDLELEIYNHSTDAWVSIDTDSTSSNCSTVNCQLSGEAVGTPANFFVSDGGSGYFAVVRIRQTNDGSTAYSLRTDTLNIAQTTQQLRGNKTFQENVLTPFRPN